MNRFILALTVPHLALGCASAGGASMGDQDSHLEAANLPAGQYVVRSGLGGSSLEDGLALANDGSNAADGSAVGTQRYRSPITGANFKWTLTPAADGKSFAIANDASGKCLDNASSATDGVGVVQSTCSGAPSQQWQIRLTREAGCFNAPPVGPVNACGVPTYDIVSVDNGRCLDLNGGDTQVTTARCTGSQPWHFIWGRSAVVTCAINGRAERYTCSSWGRPEACRSSSCATFGDNCGGSMSCGP